MSPRRCAVFHTFVVIKSSFRGIPQLAIPRPTFSSILIGPDEAAYEQVEEELKEKVIFLSREKLQEMNDAEISRFLTEVLCETLPLYISIDKDVLCPDDAQTTWSQGDMKLTTLLSGVKTVLECAKKTGGEIVGVDICGEADVEAAHENEANDLANEKLLEILDTYF